MRHTINIRHYWKVIVCDNMDCDFLCVGNTLERIGVPQERIENLHAKALSGKIKAFTLSSTKKHISVMGMARHNHRNDLFNTIVHEAEHVKQAMLEAYSVHDSGEPPAYTVGYIAMRIMDVLGV